MSDRRLAHGFTAVDAQRFPAGWARVLDRLGDEPFYASWGVSDK
ncbi:hypothetical protein [Streptomyces sp. PTD5-9]